MRFTFNKRARIKALAAIKGLEKGSFASAILGSFSADPKVTAISALVLYIVCKVAETVIAGIEDTEQRTSRKKLDGDSGENNDSS